MSLPTSLYRADQVRELDRIAIEELEIPGFELMELAGQSAWRILQSNWPGARHICVVCGAGNNAGDGYILARLAVESSLDVSTFYITDPDSLKGDAKSAFEKFSASTGASCEKFYPELLAEVDVIVDALLGTGIDRDVKGGFYQAIEAINNTGIPVLAIDIPSGLNADTGNIMGVAVNADISVSFIGLKQGMFTAEGRQCCGRIYYSGLDVPDQVYQQQSPSATRMDFTLLSHLLTRRSRNAHKGHYGHVLVIGGDYGYSGAARMAAEAAARTGAGLVSLGTRPEHALGIPLAVPELMVRGIERAVDLNPLLERAAVVAIGPGLGQSAWSSRLLARVLDTKLPMVVDADALNLIAKDQVYSNKWILTPHVGEAARLLKMTTAEISADRFTSVRLLQKKYGGIIVLKGSGTLVADEKETIYVCSSGNPGMATAGMGDVLTGIIAALIAQGIDLVDAAKLGVSLHAAAADEAAEEDGERGLLATDLMPWIRKLVN